MNFDLEAANKLHSLMTNSIALYSVLPAFSNNPNIRL